MRHWINLVEGETFENELGNEISISVEEKPLDGVDGVLINIVGPTSETENHITREEAKVLYRSMRDLMNTLPQDCLTPGSEYIMHTTDDSIEAKVELPPEISIGNATEKQVMNLEDEIHNALEEIVAKLVRDVDPKADEHWEEARKNDKINEGKNENYPSSHDILAEIAVDCIVVGSASYKPVESCKDIDVVINQDGWNRLNNKYGFWLVPSDHDGWFMFLPEDSGMPVIEIFCQICNIVDTSKHANRITYEQALQMPLKTVEIYGVNLRALDLLSL